MTSADTREVEVLMQKYVDGLYQADSAILRKVFHSRLSYVNATAGNQEFLDLETYMARIDARPSPASRNDPRNGEVERITLKDRQMGLVEARMTMLGRDYQDLLTVVRTDNGWKVLTKVFTYVEQEE